MTLGKLLGKLLGKRTWLGLGTIRYNKLRKLKRAKKET